MPHLISDKLTFNKMNFWVIYSDMLTSKHTYSHICVYTYDYAVNYCLYFRNELLFNVQDTSPIYTSSTKLLLHLFKDGRQTMCIIVVMFPLLLPIITRLPDLSPLPPFPTGSPRSSNPNARRKRKPRPPPAKRRLYLV